METLIVYGTKHGSTKKSAEMLADKIQGDVTVVQLPASVELSKYDNVVIGSSVYMGSVRKEVKTFVEAFKAQLKLKRIGFFVCSAFSKEDEFENNYDPSLLESSLCTVNFGYEFDTKKFNFFEKMIAKAVPEDEMQTMGIMDKKVQLMADSMNQVTSHG